MIPAPQDDITQACMLHWTHTTCRLAFASQSPLPILESIRHRHALSGITLSHSQPSYGTSKTNLHITNINSSRYLFHNINKLEKLLLNPSRSRKYAYTKPQNLSSACVTLIFDLLTQTLTILCPWHVHHLGLFAAKLVHLRETVAH